MTVAASALSAAQCDAAGPICIVLEAIHHLEGVYPSPRTPTGLSHPPRRTGRIALRRPPPQSASAPSGPIRHPCLSPVPSDQLRKIADAGLPDHLALERALAAQVALDLDGLPRAMSVSSVAAKVSTLRITSDLSSVMRRK